MRPRTNVHHRLCFILSVAAVSSSGAIARAQTYLVNDTSDALDADPGNGICETATGNGQCTLRAAIHEANAGPSGSLLGSLVIQLPVGTYTLALPGVGDDQGLSGDLDINRSLTIVGSGVAGTILDGAGVDRVLDIAPNPVNPDFEVEVAISGITVRGGSAQVSDTTDFGRGGGIRNTGRLMMRNAVVTDNLSAASGGGVAQDVSAAVLTLWDCVVSDNQAGDPDSTFSGDGGGIDASGAVTLVQTRVTGNRAKNAGGGATLGEQVVMVDVEIANNTSGDHGGGLFAGSVAMKNSAVHGNRSGSTGGGMQIGGRSPSSIENTTLSNNVAYFEGGGLFAQGGGGDLVLTHVTIARNAYENDVGGGAAILRATGFEVRKVILQNSIIGPNDGENCGSNPVTANGGNLDSDGTCLLSGPGDVSNIDPVLGPLAQNGGFTPTHALLAGSPAIDAAITLAGSYEDQRGHQRPSDADGDGAIESDIGAYEVEAPTCKPEKPCDGHDHCHHSK